MLGLLAWGVNVTISCVIDLQRPSAIRFLAPEVDAEEGPVVETRAENVSWPLEQQGRRGTHRGGEQ